MAWGWTLAAGLVFGLSLSVASTVVLLRALEQHGKLHTVQGRIAVGWLIVEDLVMVLALVLLPVLADSPESGTVSGMEMFRTLGLGIATTLGKVALFAAVMLFGGRRIVPWLLGRVAASGSREMFTLAVLAIAVGTAYAAAAIFDVSFALGAFLAGMVLSESDLSKRAAADSLPLQDAFAVLFFVSVGMLFDPGIVLREPLALLVVLLVIIVGKSVAAAAIVLAFRYPPMTALTIAASLAQIGEFSFILTGLGVALGLLPAAGRDLILASALLSIVLNPWLFRVLDLPLWARWRGLPHGILDASRAAMPAQAPADVVLVGFGRVGGMISRTLVAGGRSVLVVENDAERVSDARAAGLTVVQGDAGDEGVLGQLPLSTARVLIVSVPDSFVTHSIAARVRRISPRLEMIVRTHDERQAGELSRLPGVRVFYGERELAAAMTAAVQGTDARSPASASGRDAATT
jgi:CPA2 family monovalent cation:H+ antiporter-2